MTPIKIESKHYMILPAPAFWISPLTNNFQISFSGIAIIENFKGHENQTWRNDQLDISNTEMGWDIIMQRVQANLPPLPPRAVKYEFIPLQWVTYGTVNSQFDENNSVNAGFGAWNFGINKKGVSIIDSGNIRSADVLSGVNVKIQVRDKDAIIYRIGYSLSVYGYFVPVLENVIG
ncbi:MAG: hypothetical protein IPN43_11895 [Chitinophagaceae bacterium]|nr:hypothetical protein [Chitinophagaceae bacterium]